MNTSKDFTAFSNTSRLKHTKFSTACYYHVIAAERLALIVGGAHREHAEGDLGRPGRAEDPLGHLGEGAVAAHRDRHPDAAGVDGAAHRADRASGRRGGQELVRDAGRVEEGARPRDPRLRLARLRGRVGDEDRGRERPGHLSMVALATGRGPWTPAAAGAISGG